MDVRILDLDGGIVAQPRLLDRCRPAIFPVRDWGPRLRMTCAFSRFRGFEQDLNRMLGGPTDERPQLTFIGSGDFHHVSLALLRRLTVPCNLLVIDNHPDWMAGIPVMHCGTWLHHAARLPTVRHVFHVGGDVDFDNYYRWLAPRRLLRKDRITVFPSIRRYERWPWHRIANAPLRFQPDREMHAERIEELLHPYREELASRPLYISLDKDVMTTADAIVNWDSGHLHWSEVSQVLEAFGNAAKENLVGMDVVGDWSPVRMEGALRHLMHWTEHPPLTVVPGEAAALNEATNVALLESAPLRRLVRTGHLIGPAAGQEAEERQRRRAG